MTITIQSGTTVILTTTVRDTAKWVKEIMPDNYSDYVEVSFETDIYYSLLRGYHIAFNGDTYALSETAIPVINKETGGFIYTLQFVSYIDFYFPNTILVYYDEAAQRRETDFVLTGTAYQFLQMVTKNVGNIFAIGEYPATEIKTVTFENVTIKEGLDLIAAAFLTEWWVVMSPMTINLSELRTGTEIELTHDQELEEISSSKSSKEIFDLIYAYGSTRNIPENYYQKSGSVNVSTTRRLRIPHSVLGIDYVSLGTFTGSVKQGVVIFEDIYPRRVGTITELFTETVYISGNEGATTTSYLFRDSGIVFDEKYILPGHTLKMVFQSGNLNGREFEVAYGQETGKYIIRFTNDGVIVPNTSLYPAVGDTYVLFNFDISLVQDQFVKDAEQELLTKATEYLENQANELVYDCKTRSIYCEENTISLSVGQRVSLTSDIFSKSGLRIRGFEKNLINEYEATYFVGDHKKKSRLSILHKEIKENYVRQIVVIGSQQTNEKKMYSSGSGYSGASQPERIPFTNEQFPEITDYQLGYAAIYGDNPILEIITIENGKRVHRIERPEITLTVDLLIDTIKFDLNAPETGYIIIR